MDRRVISTEWILYLIVFAAFFVVAFYGLSALDFSKFAHTSNPQKIYVLLFLFSLGIAWICTQAVFSLTVYRGY